MSTFRSRALELTRLELCEQESAVLDLALTLVHEAAVYGVDALPHDIVGGHSGRALATMVCEDVEGALAVESLLAARRIEVQLPPEETKEEGEDTPVEPHTEIRTVHPTVLERAEGRGLPSVVLASRHPEVAFTVLETDKDRRWMLRRLGLLLGLRSLRVVEAVPEGASFDLLLLKHVEAAEARQLALRWLAPAGGVALWQDRDRSAEIRRYWTNQRGEVLKLRNRHALRGDLTHGRFVFEMLHEAAELDAAASRA